VTCNATIPPAPTAAAGAPTPIRVSNNRDGANDVKPPGVLTTADAPATPDAPEAGATAARRTRASVANRAT